MQFFYHNPVSIGVDIGEQSIKLVACQKRGSLRSREALNISHIQEIVFTSSENNEDRHGQLTSHIDTLAEALKTMTKVIRRPIEVILGIPEHQSFIVTTQTIDPNRALIPQVHAILERDVPLPLDALYFDAERIPSNPNNPRFIIGSASKTYVDAVIRAVDAAGITVAALDFEGLASLRSVTRVLPVETKERWMLIDLGATRTYCILANGEAIEQALRLPTSGNALTHHIAETLHFSPEQAEQRKRECGLDPTLCTGALKEIITPPFDLVRMRVEEIIHGSHADTGAPIRSVCLVGGGAHMPGVQQYFTDALHLPVFLPSLLEHTRFVMSAVPPPSPLRFTAALGLALRGLINA